VPSCSYCKTEKKHLILSFEVWQIYILQSCYLSCGPVKIICNWTYVWNLFLDLKLLLIYFRKVISNKMQENTLHLCLFIFRQAASEWHLINLVIQFINIPYSGSLDYRNIGYWLCPIKAIQQFAYCSVAQYIIRFNIFLYLAQYIYCCHGGSLIINTLLLVTSAVWKRNLNKLR
jgi:hypothetical protein